MEEAVVLIVETGELPVREVVKDFQALSGLCIPETQGAITRGRENPATIGGKGTGGYILIMPLEDPQGFP